MSVTKSGKLHFCASDRYLGEHENIFHQQSFLCCSSPWRWSVTQPITINVNIRSALSKLGAAGRDSGSQDTSPGLPESEPLSKCYHLAWRHPIISNPFFYLVCECSKSLYALACKDPLIFVFPAENFSISISLSCSAFIWANITHQPSKKVLTFHNSFIGSSFLHKSNPIYKMIYTYFTFSSRFYVNQPSMWWEVMYPLFSRVT